MRHGAFLAPTLHELLGGSDLERADRALVTDLAYGTVRRLIQCDAALAPLLARADKLPPAVLDALRLGTYEVLHRGTPRYAAVSAWVETVKREEPRLAGLVNAVLRRVAPLAGATPAVAASLPEWLYAGLRRSLSGHVDEAAAAMLEPEPLWLTAFGPSAVPALEADGATVTTLGVPVPGRPFSLAARAPVSVERLRAFQEGLVQPQNPSSLAVALLLDPEPGGRVLDLASGVGVKSAALAALGARVTAVELSPRRSAAARSNLRRLGLGVEHVTADLRGPPALEPAPHVLLDAPCTGTGTLRGHPEIKLRLTPADVVAAADRQAAMLRTAAAVTSPGGVLQYAVCSLMPEEGPQVVERFLREESGFVPEPLDLALPHVAASRLPTARRSARGSRLQSR